MLSVCISWNGYTKEVCRARKKLVAWREAKGNFNFSSDLETSCVGP